LHFQLSLSSGRRNYFRRLSHVYLCRADTACRGDSMPYKLCQRCSCEYYFVLFNYCFCCTLHCALSCGFSFPSAVCPAGLDSPRPRSYAKNQAQCTICKCRWGLRHGCDRSSSTRSLQAVMGHLELHKCCDLEGAFFLIRHRSGCCRSSAGLVPARGQQWHEMAVSSIQGLRLVASSILKREEILRIPLYGQSRHVSLHETYGIE
jgi:hypothetical protein